MIKTIILTVLISLIAIQAETLDYPHNGSNSIGCDSCHYVYADEPSHLPPWTNHDPLNIDDTQYNTLCWSCHNNIKAPYMKTHSSLNTSDKYGDSDNDGEAGWSMECKVCHHPHQQRQIKTYGSESYLYSGTVTSVTESTLTEDGANWAIDEYRGNILYPKATSFNYNYKITGNTEDTITVRGAIRQDKVSADDTFAIVYGNLIKNTIATPNSGDMPVKFFRDRGDHSFSDGDSVRDGICESCHTETIHWRNDGNEPGPGHNLGARCVDCHWHVDGFKGRGCDGCHGYPPVLNVASGGPDALVNNPGTTGSLTAGAHDKHVNTKQYLCANCHYDSVGSGPSHNNGEPQDVTIGFWLFNGTYLGGIYDGQPTVNYDTNEENTELTNEGSKTCSNVYCHGRLPDGTKWGGGKATSPVWDGSVTCSSCHDAGGSATDLSGKHYKHTDESTYELPCEKCHYETAEGRSTIKNESYHANNVKDIIFEQGGTLNTTDKSCSSTYCHSDARGGAPNVEVKWTDQGTAGHAPCDSCHNGRTGQDTLEMSSNAHERLVSSEWVRQYKCYYCHDATVDLSSNIEDYSKHVNGEKDIVFNSKWYIAGNPPPSYEPDTMTCSNIYCHSDGTKVNPEVRAFAWDQGHVKCNTCHGHEAGTCHECHDDGRTDWPAGDEWKSAMPMYQNEGVGSSNANTHSRHLLTDYNCNNCHANTVIGGSCTDCHVSGIPTGSMGEVNHINPDYHVNKVKDIAFKNGGTFDPVEKKCSNTACHTGTEPQWGDSVNNTVICLGCHGTTEGDVDDYVYKNDVRAKINMNEWEVSGHGRPASEGNYASGNPPANFPGNPCWYCHDNSVFHGKDENPFRLRQHDQFSKRFEKECVYCHMEGQDNECLNCHNADNSLAPQLVNLTDPPYAVDHSSYTDGQTSCVVACHSTDDQRHKTNTGIWTSEEKEDIRSQYVNMGVCLVCHDDDSNNRCEQCHTGEQYKLGFDPGTGFISASTAKATSTHFGYKHYAAYQNDGVWKGGKFCWDCHDPHGDENIYMIHDEVSTETDGKFGIPVATSEVSFTRSQTGLDYARSSEPYNGICQVCHTEGRQHYRNDYGDGHNSGRRCTTCHEHRFTDSHASGKACNTCHQNKPVPRHTAFYLPRDCTKCHNGVIYGRMDIMGQLRSNSHHIQGVEVTNKHCYACHWEATENGLINVEYHSGYNYKTHESTKDDPVNLVIWGPGERPETYDEGTTGVAFEKNKIGTVDERSEVAEVTQVCLGCHSDQNNDTMPFNIVDPDNGDCKTPREYAWDRMSIAARYSQTGTTTWGKYTGTANASPKNLTKAFSAHGNAVSNEGGWDPDSGYDSAIPNTRSGSANVQCYDCHNSHGSKAEGNTSSYVTFNGTYNGGNLKETQAGKGGYLMTYKPTKNTDPDSVNPYGDGAGLCFDCHETETAGAKPWGYSSTFGATEPIRGYKDTPQFGPGTKGSTARYSYRESRSIMGGHLNASSDLENPAKNPINGLCTPCHDPHGVSPTLGDNQQYAVPLLKGTWMTSPYKEDASQIQVGSRSYQSPGLYWWTDRRTFGGERIAEDPEQFAGLCLSCHPKENLTDGVKKNTVFKTRDRIHESVKGWGTNTEHSWPCAKCHQPHNSGLPRLMQTNCLDYNHVGRVASGGMYKSDRGRYPRQKNSAWVCHEAGSAGGGSWTEQRWNNVTPW